VNNGGARNRKLAQPYLGWPSTLNCTPRYRIVFVIRKLLGALGVAGDTSVLYTPRKRVLSYAAERRRRANHRADIECRGGAGCGRAALDNERCFERPRNISVEKRNVNRNPRAFRTQVCIVQTHLQLGGAVAIPIEWDEPAAVRPGNDVRLINRSIDDACVGEWAVCGNAKDDQTRSPVERRASSDKETRKRGLHGSRYPKKAKTDARTDLSISRCSVRSNFRTSR